MTDNDNFPDDDFDPYSGEFSNEFDFEPTFSERVYLTEENTAFADVFTEPDFEPDGDRIVNTLKELVSQGVFEEDYNPHNPDDRPPIPDDFDYADKNVRGPFIGPEAVNRWLRDSGLEDVALPYYNEEYDEYWIDVNTN